MLRRPARPPRAPAAATVFALALTLALAVGGCRPADPAGSSAASPAGRGGQAAGTTAAPPIGAPQRPTGPTEEATLLRVVDGDTIRVLVGGREERVRYIGIDTPEPNPSSPATPEPYAAAATAANARLLAAGRLVLEQDVSERDRFGRLLRHAWTQADGRWTLLSLVLVAEGFAEAATYPPDVKYVDAFVAAQRDARAAGRGLWGAVP